MIHLSVAGHQPRKQNWVDQAFDLYAIGFVVSGRGSYRVDDGPVQPIRPGTLFSVYPGSHFVYGPDPGTSWSEYHVGGIGPGIKRWLALDWIPQSPTIHPVKNIEGLVAAFEAMLAGKKNAQPGDEGWQQLHRAEGVLLAAQRARHHPQETQTATHCLGEAMDDLHQRYAEDLDFERLAENHRMSYSALRQGIKRRTGLSPGRYVARLRCEAAQRLLTDTDESVAHIGERVGIPNPYLFSRVFKRVTGLPPLRFRQQTRGFAGR